MVLAASPRFDRLVAQLVRIEKPGLRICLEQSGDRPTRRSALNQNILLGVDGYVTAERCLEILFPENGLCLRTFRTLQAHGRIPHLKIGRRTLFNPAEVIAAL